ncbi:G-protein beta WD- 40 repeats containing protein [Penicillium canariense]|uniref:G-protein beta WD- 40 repeats containing protein n=1 Tax=Penicillium canariense TaxID=189055 RepID=A0A9W9HQV9_9EURO|nr:G-protein beta WD- 40 repeats containing protein [Penicillium canariense]KAJ5152980.1 G-protein beta WD- 40 repeats containing protein [Penicillium canariense]
MASTTYNGTNRGFQIGNNYAPVTGHWHQSYTTEDIDRFCLRNLRCPDSLVVKNRLKETKDKLLRHSFEWILQTPQYHSWRHGTDVCLLWIKGGAGKGKTMMSIGLVEELSRERDESAVVTYFFCQNADNELNTLESLIKGLILKLDTENARFNEDITSWRNLWDILLEMLDRCNSPKLIVRNGLDHPVKIKWLLTSRPLEAAERALLAGHDQMQVSLELNSRYVSEAVKTYVSHKLDELSCFHSYGKTLRRELETELTVKAEGTFLWVNLVCKRLESVRQDDALTTIQNLPPGLHPFYDRILKQLSERRPNDAQKCMRLIKAMMLAYRPLKVEEVPSVTGLTNEDNAIEALVDRCASVLRMQENNIEFVHQSVRDYLAGENGQSVLDTYERFGHREILMGCLSYLSERLKVNLLDLPRPHSTREDWNPPKDKKRCVQLSCLDYAATYWVNHLENIQRREVAQSGLIEKGAVGIFLHAKMLEWLEVFSLLDRLPWAIEALDALVNITEDDPLTWGLVQDATRFFMRHFNTMNQWPLQIYSSAVIFSPESSVVKRENLDKIPGYLRNVPLMEHTWVSLIQTLPAHKGNVNTVAFSPDGKQFASGSSDGTIKLWNTATGDLQKALERHSASVNSVAFSPDGKHIISGSDDRTIKLWNTATGDLQKILGHSESVNSVAFSPDGKRIASGSNDYTIKLWDTITGDLQRTLEGHSDVVLSVSFSPDGKQIASGSIDTTIRVWDATTAKLQKILESHSGGVGTVVFSADSKQIASGHDKTIKIWGTPSGDLQKILEGHSDWVKAVAFSRDGKQIVSGSSDRTIKLWDTTTAGLQKINGHSAGVDTIAFSPDGKQFASGSYDDIKLWNTATGDLQKTLEGHSGLINTVAFSPDGKQIASSYYDKTFRIWDTTTGDLQKTIIGHSGWVKTLVFSPDGKQIASGSFDRNIQIWDTTTGDLQKTLNGHSGFVDTIVFSPDGKQIASSFSDKTIRLWAIAKPLKMPNFLDRLRSRFKIRPWKEIQTSEPVYNMKFSADNRYLVTDIGPIMLNGIATEIQVGISDTLVKLFVGNQWIFYGDLAVYKDLLGQIDKTNLILKTISEQSKNLEEPRRDLTKRKESLEQCLIKEDLQKLFTTSWYRIANTGMVHVKMGI